MFPMLRFVMRYNEICDVINEIDSYRKLDDEEKGGRDTYLPPFRLHALCKNQLCVHNFHRTISDIVQPRAFIRNVFFH